MSLTLASNIASLSAQSELNRTTEKLTSTFERLSSGLRINNASDDAAGLAISESLRSGAKIANVAIRNANDGISIISIADSALDSLNSVLSRMYELSQQSANGTYSVVQRSALSSEFVSLGSEIERISQTTSFNNIPLLSGSRSVTLQVGLNGTGLSQITIPSITGTLASIGLAASGSSRLTYSIISTSVDNSVSASRLSIDAISSAISNVSLLRGSVGAAESRLSIAIGNLQVARENFIAADSRIRDADIAYEVAEMVRLQVLQQTGAAVLAQANLQPELVLKLFNQTT